MRRLSLIAGAAALLLLGISASVWAAVTVKVDTNGGISYLTDSKGMTLYYFTKDVAGTSVCTGGCLQLWPAFYSQDITVPSELSASDFGTITRQDGSKQTTYKGWPLYYFARDTKPGDMTGEDVAKVWFVMKIPSYTVMLGTSSTLGTYLTDAKGNTLYYFTKDTTNTSVCTGGCLAKWPAFHASQFVVPTGLNPADFGTITRSDGTQQTTYKGWPLYYWVGDQQRGQTTGQGVANVWYVIDPAKLTKPST